MMPAQALGKQFSVRGISSLNDSAHPSAQSIIVIIAVRYSPERCAGIIAPTRTLCTKTDKEAAMAISLLLIALQDAWLNIGKAAAHIPAPVPPSDTAQD